MSVNTPGIPAQPNNAPVFQGTLPKGRELRPRVNGLSPLKEQATPLENPGATSAPSTRRVDKAIKDSGEFADNVSKVAHTINAVSLLEISIDCCR